MMDDSDCLVECPYNKSHRVQKSRMQTHMFKCRKHSATVEYKRCPFNANHDILLADFQHHLEVCSDRGTVQTHLAQTVKERTPVIMPYVAPVLPSEGENWDCDEPVQTYDPNAKNMNVKVLRNLQGASKSERKHHRQQERLRFNAVAENGGLEGAVGGCIENKEPINKKEAVEKPASNFNKEVRPPKTTSRTFAIPLAAVTDSMKSLEVTSKPLNKVHAPTEWSLSSEDMPSARPSATQSNGSAKGLPQNGVAKGLPQNGVAKGLPQNDLAKGLPQNDLAKGLPQNGLAKVLPQNGLARGLPQNGVTAPQQTVQVPLLGVPSWMAAAVEPLPASKKVVVDTGDNVPVPNLERDFPALGRGRGRIRDPLK